MIIMNDNDRIVKYYESNLFTRAWEEITEKEFDSLVVKHRNCFRMEYDNDVNTAVFYDISTGIPAFKRVYC